MSEQVSALNAALNSIEKSNANPGSNDALTIAASNLILAEAINKAVNTLTEYLEGKRVSVK